MAWVRMATPACWRMFCAVMRLVSWAMSASMMRERAARTLDDLFGRYMDQPSEMPQEWAERTLTGGADRRARAVCDYIAGMTDRYAIEVHGKLFSLDLALDL